MKHLLITTIATMLLVGCGELRQSNTSAQSKASEPVAEAKKQKAINSMIISYSADGYIVGENEIWKLTWKSPYEDGAITPAYDVRVYGQAYIGESRGTCVNTNECEGKNYSIVNFLSSGKKTTIWVYDKTKISIANDRVKVHLDIFDKDDINQGLTL